MHDTMIYQEIWSIIRLVIIFGFILLAIKLVRGPKKSSGQEHVDETQMIQDIYQGLEKMEERVESLETLLLERETKERR